MRKGNLYLGADVGTSSLKIILIDESGSLLLEGSEKYDLMSREDSWMEIDPECWVRAFVKAASRLLTDVDRSRIRRIGVTGQMHTLVLLGENHRPVRPAIMWNDMRTMECLSQTRSYMAQCEDGKEIETIISTGSPLANILWVRENEPEVFQKTRKFQIGWDYLVYRLTGRHCTDYCNASTSAMYSFREKAWSEQIRHLVGLSEDCYPEILGSADIVGTVTEEFRDALGLGPETEVIMGTGDNPATIFSAGAYWKNHSTLSLGTSGVLTRRSEEDTAAYFRKRIAFAFHKDECGEMEQGAIQSCASTYNWWIQNAGIKDHIRELEDSIDIRTEVEKKVLFSPHLAGDKTLYADADLKGMFVGLDLHTTEKTMLYAVLEGIAFSVRELLDRMEVFERQTTPIQVLGGVSENKLFMQILADVTGHTFEKIGNCASGAVYGIAILAAKVGEISELDTVADKHLKVEAVYHPDKSLKERFDRKYNRYLRMQKAYHYIYSGNDKGENNAIYSSRKEA